MNKDYDTSPLQWTFFVELFGIPGQYAMYIVKFLMVQHSASKLHFRHNIFKCYECTELGSK